MPKHFNRNKQQSWANDRVNERDRRVAFKYKRNDRRDFKKWSNIVESHLEDGDVDMMCNAGSNRNNKFYKKKKSGGQGSVPSQNGKKALLEAPSNWYKVSLLHGSRFDKAFILKILTDKMVPLPFWPITWKAFGTTVTFYIDNFEAAQKLNSLNRKINLPNGYKLFIRVYPGCPNVDMTPALKEKMKLVMARRYNGITKALDLTRFHADPDLQDSFCALFKPNTFLAIVDIIAENIPELHALNLSENNIQIMHFLKDFDKKFPNLQILYLGYNRIRDIKQLDSLQGLPLLEVLLEGNPVCDKFKDKPAYICAVRKRFPNCVKLDGVDLPPLISFDIEEEVVLPDPQKRFLCDIVGGSIVDRFIEQYFLIYDTENRQPLLQAYHERAVFSLTTNYPYRYGKETKGVARLNWYATDNRNLLRINDPQRTKLLKQGQLAITSFLQEIPQTKHDIHGFTVDLNVMMPQLLCLTVAGMFKELKSDRKIPPLRYFFKTLVIVPSGSGFCIANETLHITNATPQQGKEAFTTPLNVLAPPSTATVTSPDQSFADPTVVSSADIIPVPDDRTKQEMLKQMSLQSGMNQDWSFKCLEEMHWNFQKALAAFQNLNAQGVVPANAFFK